MPEAVAAPAAGGRWSPERIHERRWATLSVLCLSLVIVIVGNTVLNVAIPTLQRELGASNTELQWIVDAYALVFAGLLLTAGALGDRFGRKGALQLGLVIFGLASAAASFSTQAEHLIAARAVLGVAAALIMPATLSILTWVFPPEERAKAIAVWAGLSGAGAAIGPLTSGWLLERYWWGSVFLVSVPIVALALGAGSLLVPRSKDPESAPLDPVGAGLSIVGLTALVFAIIEGSVEGWTDPLIVGSFTLSALALGAFGWWELRSKAPMLDLRLFRNPALSAASGAITLVFFAMFGLFFLMAQYLQLVLGYTPLESGVRTLPMAAGMMIGAPLSARFVARVGPRVIVTSGLAIVASGLMLFSTVDVGDGYPLVVSSLVTMAFGMGFTMAPATATIMAAMPMGKAGVGSAVNDTTRELGGALGIAVLGSIAATQYRAGIERGLDRLPVPLPEPAVDAAKEQLGAALAIARDLGTRAGAPVADAFAEAARSAFIDGLATTMRVGAVFTLVAAGVVFRFLPKGVLAAPHGGGPGGPAAQAGDTAGHGGAVPAVDPGSPSTAMEDLDPGDPPPPDERVRADA